MYVFAFLFQQLWPRFHLTRPEPQVDLQKHPARHIHMQSTQAYIYHYYSQNVQTNILHTQQVRTSINNECDRSNRECVCVWAGASFNGMKAHIWYAAHNDLSKSAKISTLYEKTIKR